jgi:WD40 repeat protein
MPRRTVRRFLSPFFLILPLAVCCGCSFAQTPRAKINQILEGIVAPHYYDGEWDISPDGKTLALPYFDARGNSPDPDGRTLVPPRAKRGVELWDLTVGKSRWLPDPRAEERGASSVAFSKGGRALAAAHSRGVSIWAVPDGKEIARIPQLGGVNNMVFTDADRTLVAKRLESLDGHRNPPESHYVVASWDVSSGRLLTSVDFAADRWVRDISPDGRYGITHDLPANDTGIYDLTTRAKLFGLPKFGDAVFSDDGSTTVHLEGNELSIWEVPSGKALKRFDLTLRPPAGNNCVLSISSRAKLLAVGRFPTSHLVSVISLESGEVLVTAECGPRLTICDRVRLSADGRTLVTSTNGANLNDEPVLPWLKIWRLPEKW